MRAELCQIVFSVRECSLERDQTRVTSPDLFSLLEIKLSGLSSSMLSQFTGTRCDCRILWNLDSLMKCGWRHWSKTPQKILQIAGLIIRVTHITDGKLLCKKIQGGGFEERIFIANFSSTTMKAERAGIQNNTRLSIHEFTLQVIYYTYKLDIFLKYW